MMSNTTIKQKKEWRLGYLLIVFLFIGVLTNTFVQSKREYAADHAFVIKKIDTTATKQLVLYGADGKKIDFWNYSIRADEGVEIGDSVRKATEGVYLFIFRKDTGRHYKEYLRIKPTGMFTRFIFKNIPDQAGRLN